MSKYGKLIANDTVEFQRLLPGPIDRVWSFLIDPDKRSTWLAAGNTALKKGGTTELIFNNSKLSSQTDVKPADKYKDMPDCVSFKGVITQCEPPYILSYTWPGEEADSEVRFELKEKEDKVLLILTHSRLKNTDEGLSICGGWHTHLNILEDAMNGREPKPFWMQHNELEKEYENLDFFKE